MSHDIKLHVYTILHVHVKSSYPNIEVIMNVKTLNIQNMYMYTVHCNFGKLL